MNIMFFNVAFTANHLHWSTQYIREYSDIQEMLWLNSFYFSQKELRGFWLLKNYKNIIL